MLAENCTEKYGGDVRGFDDDAKMEKILADSMGSDDEWKPITYDEEDE